MKTGTIISESYAKLNRLQALQYYIKIRDLTSALTLIEESGFSGEAGLFVLAHAQAALEVTK